MEDLFKKFFYTGVGIVSTTADSLQKSVDEWISKGTISKDEGKKIIEDFVNEAQEKREAYSERVKDMMGKARNRMDLPSREEIEQLNARIADLESKLADQSKAAKKD